MNKARAMLDALMGPGRDVVEKDKGKAKDKFKDPSVCKAFLAGLCPLDPGLLGGKRNFAVCDKIHSDIMRGQFEQHEDRKELEWDYKLQCMKSLEHAVRECEARILNEKARIRDDWGNRRPPLPVHVIDQVSRMKRESSATLAMAESLDDDKLKEKEQLLARSNEIMKDAEALEDSETKKAIKAAITEEVCEICGTCFQGSAGDAAHLKFKVHAAYKDVRDKLEELRPLKEEWEKKRKERDGDSKRGSDDKKKRRENGDAGSDDAKDRKRRSDSRKRSRSKDRKKERKADSRDRGRSRSNCARREPSRRKDSRARSRGGGGSRRDDSRGRGGGRRR